jgi:hypothetical protein
LPSTKTTANMSSHWHAALIFPDQSIGTRHPRQACSACDTGADPLGSLPAGARKGLRQRPAAGSRPSGRAAPRTYELTRETGGATQWQHRLKDRRVPHDAATRRRAAGRAAPPRVSGR